MQYSAYRVYTEVELECGVAISIGTISTPNPKLWVEFGPQFDNGGREQMFAMIGVGKPWMDFWLVRFRPVSSRDILAPGHNTP